MTPQKTNKEKLKPCPFCGGKDLIGPHFTDYMGDNYSPNYWIECDSCPAGMEIESEDINDIIMAWNARSKNK